MATTEATAWWMTNDERQELREGRIAGQRNSLVRVEQAELVSGERVRVCKSGEHPNWRSNDYHVLEPAHLWSLGWFLDGPRDPVAEGSTHIAHVLRDDICDNRKAGTSHAIPEHATRGVLVLFVYAIRGRFRTVQPSEFEAVAADVLNQMANNPVNDGIGVIHVPLGYSLATLDPTRIEFWRNSQPVPPMS